MGSDLVTGLANSGALTASVATRARVRTSELLFMGNFPPGNESTGTCPGKRELTHRQVKSSLSVQALLFLVQEPERLCVNDPAAATAGFFLKLYPSRTA